MGSTAVRSLRQHISRSVKETTTAAGMLRTETSAMLALSGNSYLCAQDGFRNRV